MDSLFIAAPQSIGMVTDVFDRETLLDLTVNGIPLFMILAFIALFAVVAPWGYNLVDTTIQMALMIFHFFALFALTYVAGKAIAGAEEQASERSNEIDSASHDSGGEMTGAQAGESSDGVPRQTASPAKTGGESDRSETADTSDAREGDAESESATESRSSSDQN